MAASGCSELSKPIGTFRDMRPDSLIARAHEVGATASEGECLKACEVKALHDRVEEVAYGAFPAVVKTLKLRGDRITEVQSGQILAFIKARAHGELRRPGGYMAERGKLLDPSQVTVLMANVDRIVKDRDTKLTDARYGSFSTLVMAFDDHNGFVKELLFQSWFKTSEPLHVEDAHLHDIKGRVAFYPEMNAALEMDLEAELCRQRVFWDTYFPGIREPSSSDRFVNVVEVRDYFGGNVTFDIRTEGLCLSLPDGDSIEVEDLEMPLIGVLPPDHIRALFEKRTVENHVRRMEMEMDPLIDDTDMSVAQFLKIYFPECVVKTTKKANLIE